jgi:hypothetical protein
MAVAGIVALAKEFTIVVGAGSDTRWCAGVKACAHAPPCAASRNHSPNLLTRPQVRDQRLPPCYGDAQTPSCVPAPSRMDS